MRLWYLPITTRRALIYCEPIRHGINGAKPSIEHRITAKIADTWKTWEKAEQNWKRTLVTYVNKALDQIPYEEWGLRSIPAGVRSGAQSQQLENSTLIYPKDAVLEENISKYLTDLVRRRLPYHRKWMVICAAVAPLTLPLAAVPIVPNIPGFFLLYRVWCHSKALSGARKLDAVRSSKTLEMSASEDLAEAYNVPHFPGTAPVAGETRPHVPHTLSIDPREVLGREEVLLQSDRIPHISALFGDDHSELIASELARAHRQIIASMNAPSSAKQLPEKK
ncbi:hypothetical protein CANCADRAFT_78384 [Tortispora caseinolytica NRRL Y-17796]|uniref:Uncharacterized protein n=1 Tax=Tortispora caseinolytica NRRL Y-17796 TaxID=767744 RepID=A0A1E4TJD8_9ASCO|nr:hypothetical protein CANCADRAFT_78384 [Tortispora caseinolytica NRRL Y-17796]